MGRKEKESKWSAGHRKGRYARSTMINGVRSKTGDVGVIDIGLLPLPNGRGSAGLKNVREMGKESLGGEWQGMGKKGAPRMGKEEQGK